MIFNILKSSMNIRRNGNPKCYFSLNPIMKILTLQWDQVPCWLVMVGSQWNPMANRIHFRWGQHSPSLVSGHKCGPALILCRFLIGFEMSSSSMGYRILQPYLLVLLHRNRFFSKSYFWDSFFQCRVRLWIIILNYIETKGGIIEMVGWVEKKNRNLRRRCLSVDNIVNERSLVHKLYKKTIL